MYDQKCDINCISGDTCGHMKGYTEMHSFDKSGKSVRLGVHSASLSPDFTSTTP